MAKGDYATAETLAAKGKEIRQFQTEADELRKRWRAICGGGTAGAKKSASPLWSYYQPILQALVQAGGECRGAGVEEHVERLMNASLLPADRDMMAGSRERWRVMVKRARRPLIAEGWIEDRPGAFWRITDAGRRAAEQPPREGKRARS